MQHVPRVGNGCHFGHKFSGFVSDSDSIQEAKTGLNYNHTESESERALLTSLLAHTRNLF